MPYIKQEKRDELKNILDQIERLSLIEIGPGELNFLITKLIHQYVEDNNISYKILNDIIGALDNAKEEFRRRVINPYEDLKIVENGDV